MAAFSSASLKILSIWTFEGLWSWWVICIRFTVEPTLFTEFQEKYFISSFGLGSFGQAHSGFDVVSWLWTWSVTASSGGGGVTVCDSRGSRWWWWWYLTCVVCWPTGCWKLPNGMYAALFLFIWRKASTLGCDWIIVYSMMRCGNAILWFHELEEGIFFPRSLDTQQHAGDVLCSVFPCALSSSGKMYRRF